MRLTDVEKLAGLGLAARYREAAKLHAEAASDEKLLVSLIEKRLELAEGSIGLTHALDLASGEVVEQDEED